MGTLTVRNVDDGLLANLAKTAKLNKRSVSALVRELIAESDRKRQVEEVLANIKRRRERNPIRLRPGEDAVSLIRAVREEE